MIIPVRDLVQVFDIESYDEYWLTLTDDFFMYYESENRKGSGGKHAEIKLYDWVTKENIDEEEYYIDLIIQYKQELYKNNYYINEYDDNTSGHYFETVSGEMAPVLDGYCITPASVNFNNEIIARPTEVKSITVKQYS